MKRLFVFAVLCLSIAAAGLYAAYSQGIPPAGQALMEARLSEDDWSPPTHLPPGAEYHLIRESPKTGGIQAIARFPSGYAVPEHTHSCDETFVVLKGRLLIRTGERESVLGPGGFAVMPAGTPHELAAKTWLRKTVFFTMTDGPYDLKYTE